ncbi:MAG: phosphoenolpyruvate carboxykinase [Planctomycetes bacterium]|nr:phosphoenolpyruvate carboxykinase [Planctomycetota bacterium]
MNIFETEIKAKSILNNPSPKELRELAKKDEITTEFGSASYTTKINSRSAKFTEIIFDKPTPQQEETISKVMEYLKTKDLIMIERTMCRSKEIALGCRYYVTKEFSRIAYGWGETLFPKTKDNPFGGNAQGKPDMTTIDIPEWPERKVLVHAGLKKTFILGTDYTGEVKKSFLRLGMWIAKQKGWLGFHAGSKELIVTGSDGKLVSKGVLLFGLSGTGKTTLTCHHHFLKGEETVKIRQDDVVFLKDTGYCIGTEDNFYMKTEGLSPTQDPLLYKAVTAPHAVLENVWVDKATGKVDFTNYQVTSNGRAIVRRKDMGYTDDAIDIPYANILVFIFRRADIMPPVAKLSLEQAAAFFMLGESVETSAGDPTQAGKQKRVVGTNPFIIGPEEDEGNIFYNILKKRGDIEVYVMNTGKVGGAEGAKIGVVDSANIIKHIAKGDIKWKEDPDWHYQVPEQVPDMDAKKFEPRNYYKPEEYGKLVAALKAERKDWLNTFKGLKQEIKDSIK